MIDKTAYKDFENFFLAIQSKSVTEKLRGVFFIIVPNIVTKRVNRPKVAVIYE